MELEAMAAQCTAVADTFDEQLQGRKGVQTEMIDVLALSCEDYSRRVDHLHRAVDAAHRMNLYEFRAANRLRAKTLDAEAHAAEVTAGQPCACRGGHRRTAVRIGVHVRRRRY